MFAFGSWQGTAGSQRLELTVANVGTTGYHFKELPVPRGWDSWFPTWQPWVTIASNCRLPEVGTHASQPGNHRLPLQRTSGSERLELTVPNVGTKGYHGKDVCVWFMARNCRFPKVGTHCCQRGNHRLPLQGTAGSQRLELLVPNPGTMGYHCKQLPVTRGWNSYFPAWEP